MNKDEVLAAALEVENRENLLSGDIWLTIENEKYPNGIFLNFAKKEVIEGAYGYGETFCIYGYENKVLNGEIETDYNNTLIDFEFTKKELDELIKTKDLPYGVEFLEIMLKRSSENYQKINDMYETTLSKYKELLNLETNLKKYLNSVADDIEAIKNDENITRVDERELEVLENVKKYLSNILEKSNNKNSEKLEEFENILRDNGYEALPLEQIRAEMNNSQNKDKNFVDHTEQNFIRKNK